MPDMPPADNTDESGVLRPFVDHPHEPLPPVVPPEFVAPEQVPVDPPAPPAPPAPQRAARPEPRPQESTPRESHQPTPEPSKGGTVAVSKTTLAVVGSLVAVALSILVFLWQTSSSGGSPTESVSSEGTPTVPVQATDNTAATTTAAPTTTIADTVDGLKAQLEEARAA